MHLHDAEASCKLFFIPLELVLLQVQHLELCAVQEPAPEASTLVLRQTELFQFGAAREIRDFKQAIA